MQELWDRHGSGSSVGRAIDLLSGGQGFKPLPGPCRPLLFKHVCCWFFGRVVQSAGLMPRKYRSTKNNSVVTLHAYCAHPLVGKVLKPWYLQVAVSSPSKIIELTYGWYFCGVRKNPQTSDAKLNCGVFAFWNFPTNWNYRLIDTRVSKNIFLFYHECSIMLFDKIFLIVFILVFFILLRNFSPSFISIT